MKLNKDQIKNLKKWAKILSTTRKKRGQGNLRIEKSYCCLGIAAECVLNIKPVCIDNSYWTYNNKEQLLRDTDAKIMGLNKNAQKMFAEYNDDQNLSFKKIAVKVKEYISAHS